MIGRFTPSSGALESDLGVPNARTSLRGSELAHALASAVSCILAMNSRISSAVPRRTGCL